MSVLRNQPSWHVRMAGYPYRCVDKVLHSGWLLPYLEILDKGENIGREGTL